MFGSRVFLSVPLLANVVGRSSDHTLYSEAHVTFEEDDVYDQKDAEGFIRLNALRLQLMARRKRRLGRND